MNEPRRPLVLDTLGKLADRGFRMFGSCLRCSHGYSPALGPSNQPYMFDIDLAALVAERGRDCHIIGMWSVPCPHCGSSRTELRFLPPKTGDGVEVHSVNNERGA